MKILTKAVLKRIFIKPLKNIPYIFAGLGILVEVSFIFLIMLIFTGWLINTIIPNLPKENLWVTFINSFTSSEGSNSLATGSIFFWIAICVRVGISAIVNKIKSIINEEKNKIKD